MSSCLCQENLQLQFSEFHVLETVQPSLIRPITWRHLIVLSWELIIDRVSFAEEIVSENNFWKFIISEIEILKIKKHFTEIIQTLGDLVRIYEAMIGKVSVEMIKT